VADAITNLLAARNRLDAARDASSRMQVSISVDEKMRLFEDFVTSMKMMYDKLLYGAKVSNKCVPLWKLIHDDRNDKSSLVNYLWMVRNKIEHGSSAPLRFNVEAPINVSGGLAIFSRSQLAVDLHIPLNSKGVKYSIDITEFMDNRARVMIALPTTHRGKPFDEISMERIVSICLETMIADFKEVWRAVTVP